MKHGQSLGSLMGMVLLAGGLACSSSKGGGVGSGGTVGSGGMVDSGGALASGGTVGSGGLMASGGAVGSGGLMASGGRPGAGGSVATGGSTGGGGRTGSGGAVSSGGRTGTGGVVGAGGGVAVGGSITDAGPPVSSTGCGAALPAACNTTTTGPCTLDVNGKTRQYFVVLPSGYDNSKPSPVVFAYHGRGGTASSLLPTGSPYGGGYALYGVQPGMPNAVFVVPQGLDSGSEAGTDYGWPNTGGQDIDFVRAMLTWLETNLCVDKARYFSTGMSYGGMMSETIACQMPDVFRAIGSQAGSLFGSTRNCVAKPIAAWITHGDADTTVPISGDITARDMIIANNGCDTTNTSSINLVDTARIGDAATTDVTCTVYDQCTSGNYPVIWCPVPGEGHAIPSFAGAEIAKFFARF
jgi:poly(3-hydroxybutyrate) depolymerase